MKNLLKILSAILSIVIIASSVIVANADTTYKKGVDISYHNENVDFLALKNDGYDFAMIRVGYYNHLDTRFYDNVKAVCDAGMNYGVYLYSYAFSPEESQIEANFVINSLSAIPDEYKAQMTLPVALDLEEDKILEAGLGRNEITANALLFCNSIRSAGFDPMVYANNKWFTNYIDAQEIYNNGIKIWYAHWTDDYTLQYTHIADTDIPCYMWQYSNSNNLDKNLLYIDELNDTPAIIDASSYKAKLNKSSFAYDGKAKKPSVKIYDPNGNLVDSSNYSVSYSSNKKPGKAAVKVTFKNGYSGIITKTFIIKPRKQALSKLKPFKKKINVSWKQDKTVSGYQIAYSTNKSMKKPTTKLIKSSKTTNISLSKLKSGKTYYVRIRAYKTIDGKKQYGEWSSIKSVKVK